VIQWNIASAFVSRLPTFLPPRIRSIMKLEKETDLKEEDNKESLWAKYAPTILQNIWRAAVITLFHPISVLVCWEQNQADIILRQKNRVATLRYLWSNNPLVPFQGLGAHLISDFATMGTLEIIRRIYFNSSFYSPKPSRESMFNRKEQALKSSNVSELHQYYLQFVDDFFFDMGITTLQDFIARGIVYPLTTIRFHIEGQGSGNNKKIFTGFFDCAKWIFREKGILGFYQGFSLHMVALFPDLLSLAVVYLFAYGIIKMSLNKKGGSTISQDNDDEEEDEQFEWREDSIEKFLDFGINYYYPPTITTIK